MCLRFINPLHKYQLIFEQYVLTIWVSRTYVAISAKPASTATSLKAVIVPGGHNSTRGVTPKRDLVLNYALGFPLVHILIL